MLASDVITDVKTQFGDEAGIQISDADVIRWINAGIKEISYASNLLEARATADIVAGQSEYSLPDNLLTVHNVRVDGSTIKGLSIQEADTLFPNHDSDEAQTSEGSPECWWIWAQTLVLYPTPSNSGSANLRIYYTKLAEQVQANTDTVPLPAQFDNALLDYCLSKAYEKDENWEAAQLKKGSFTNSISTIQEDVSFKEREEYPHISVSARDMGGGYGYDC